MKGDFTRDTFSTSKRPSSVLNTGPTIPAVNSQQPLPLITIALTISYRIVETQNPGGNAPFNAQGHGTPPPDNEKAEDDGDEDD